MELKEFNELRVETEKDLNEKLTLAKKMLDNGEYNYHVYIEAGLTGVIVTKIHSTNNLYNIDLEELKQEIIDIEELYSTTVGINKTQIFQTNRIDVYDEYEELESLNYEFSYRVPMKEISEDFINKVFKRKIEEKLKPVKEYKRSVDCKLMGLYKDGVIDWKTLQNLVYSDCDL